MTFSVTILGNNAALPAHGRHPTAQILNHNEKLFLIDCGEGTQMQFAKYHIKRSKIEHIFISHLHGDHIFGLMGLITSYFLLGRKKALHIYSPPGLQQIVEVHNQSSESEMSYPLIFHEIAFEEPSKILVTKYLNIYAFPLSHRINCYGFLFQEKEKERNINKESIAKYQFTVDEILQLKKGKDVVRANETFKNEEHTLAASPIRSYVYCTDTLPVIDKYPLLKNSDMLYHETTFTKEEIERAEITYHTTTHQAATIAKQLSVKKLLMGHYSAKYKSLEKFELEAREIFAKSYASIEGETYSV